MCKMLNQYKIPVYCDSLPGILLENVNVDRLTVQIFQTLLGIYTVEILYYSCHRESIYEDL